MTGDVAALVARLDATGGACCEAEAALTALGAAAVPALTRALPGLTPKAQLHAVDALVAIGDPAAGGALAALLDSPDDRVRTWAANALAELGVTAAVPALERAWAATKAARTPLTFLLPVALRAALTALGARPEVLPPAAAATAVDLPRVGRVWPVRDAPAAVEAFAAAGYAVLDVTPQQVRDGAAYWLRGVEEEPAVDERLPWPDLVAAARDRALRAIAALPRDDPTLHVALLAVAESDRDAGAAP
ncbi:MAG TPA: HEAT repeat domain-containing protein [Mycobacteriales bacterium]|nr:HEAT repeat domain-containing protein [Mycobacteriales bacterium]